MKSTCLLLAILFGISFSAFAETLEKKPNDAYFAPVAPKVAPVTKRPLLKSGTRLAICGDSITEQRLYSRIMETYITVALPELNVNVRQFGWSGEQALGFLARMTNDVLRFNPTLATTCYGMNDHHYRPYEANIGSLYLSNMTAIVKAFKSRKTTVIIGSPGCMGLKDKPYPFILGTAEERNGSLCTLRNLDIDLARRENEPFADVFWPMYKAQYQARQEWGTNYALAGKDCIHPGWAGHVVMAYAFLKALDVPGDIGTFTVDLRSGVAKVSEGHEVVTSDPGSVTIRSTRYPFCATGATDQDTSIRSGMTLVPFNHDLNRLILVVKHADATRYKVSWGANSKDCSVAELKHGINLADDFPENPFTPAFNAVDEAVAKKQAYETKQIKELFHGKSGKTDMAKTVAETEAERAPLVEAIREAFVPVTHTITLTPE